MQITLLVVTIIGSFVLWRVSSNIKKSQVEKDRSSFEELHNEAVAKFEGKVEKLNTLTAGITAFMESSDSLPSNLELRDYIDIVLEQIDYQDSIVVSFVNVNFDFIYTFTRTSNDPNNLKGTSVKQFREASDLSDLDSIMLYKKCLAFPPFNLVEGWPGIALHMGVHRGGEPVGFVAPIVNINYLISETLPSSDIEHLYLTKDHFMFDLDSVRTNPLEQNYYKKHIHWEKSEVNLFGTEIQIVSFSDKESKLSSTLNIIVIIWFVLIIALVIMLFRQIGKAKLINQELQNSKKEMELLSIVARETENVIIIMDKDGNLQWVNESFERLNQITFDELLKIRGTNIMEISNSEDIKRHIKTVQSSLESVRYSALNKLDDGTEVWEDTTLNPILNHKGELERLIIIDSDITELKKIELELISQKDNLARLSIVAEKMSEAVVITDSEGNIEYYNQGMLRNSGYSKEEFEGMFSDEFKIQAISSYPLIDEVIKNFKISSKKVSYESEHGAKDGSSMWTKASLMPVYENDELEKVIIVYTDIDEIRRFSNQLQIKNKEVLDSINYAKRLQNTILPNQSLIQNNYSDSFVLFQPKDVVSGDFYWAYQSNESFYLAAADCTGHGVPGAMVSMVCSDALNKSVKQSGITKPGEVLDRAREFVKETFSSEQGVMKDGMDVALLVKKGNELSFSGANNPLWVVRKTKLISKEILELKGTVKGKEYSLYEIKADKQPVGDHFVANPFTTINFELFESDKYYLFTDGYPDQFGGPKGKKFLYKRFKELILSNSSLSMSEQQVILELQLKEWMQDNEQVDDICIVGLKP